MAVYSSSKSPIISLANLSNGSYIATFPPLRATVDDASAAFGNALYIAADGNYERCNAGASATMPCTALALEAGAGTKLVLLQGYIRNDSWGFTPNGCVWVSTTSGVLSQTAPSGSAELVHPVGYAHTSGILLFTPLMLHWSRKVS